MRLAHFTTLIAGLFVAGFASAFEVEDRRLFEASPQRSVLKVISTADLDVFTPIIRAFQADNPGIAVDYTVTGTTDLMGAIHDEGAQFDLAISSARDLQTKLVNDGFAQPYTAPANVLPDWAIWRDHLFAFTQEPAVLVVSDRFFAPGEAPRNRDELITLLRENPDRFRGRIGTYDVRTSGFGYLVATQDSPQFRGLLAADGGNGAAGCETLLLLGRHDPRCRQWRAGAGLQCAGQLRRLTTTIH